MLCCLQLLAVLFITQHAQGYRILGVFHFPSRSHHILGSSLLKALADKGHEVTMISPFPLKEPHPNYYDIELTGIMDLAEGKSSKAFLKHWSPFFIAPQVRNIFKGSVSMSGFEGIATTYQYITMFNEFALNHSSVKNLIASKQTFDVVIQVYFGNDAYLGLAYYLKAHSVVFCPIGSSEVTNQLTKNPAPVSYIPSIILGHTADMNFLQRVGNALANIFFQIIIFINDSEQNSLLSRYLTNSPAVHELRKNVSLVLLNSHFAIEGPRPYLPNMILVGGLHVNPSKELTNDLKQFMDSASDGVILFSLGSNVRSSELPVDTLQAIIYTFAALPQKVLWKFETTTGIPNVPPNVKISNWLPQREILAHPNLRVFVTHGGLLSLMESVYHGVPIVAIPIMNDQMNNVNQAVNTGYAVKVDAQDITFETLSRAINEVLHNSSYKTNAQKLSRIFKDQPTSALAKAVYWIEYVIKHNGAHHLKSPAVELEWYQLYSVDVFAFLISTLLCLVLVLFSVMRRILLWLARKLCKAQRENCSKVKQN